MFDSKTGMIVDDQVDYTAREMALSLDNKGVDDLNKIIQRALSLSHLSCSHVLR